MRLSSAVAGLSLMTGLLACAGGDEPLSEEQTSTLPIYTDGVNAAEAGPTSLGDVEHIGLLVHAGGVCSGILISARTALTAEHCHPAVGDDLLYGNVHYSIAAVTPPPERFRTAWGPYDVSILTLDRDVVYPGTNTPFVPYAEISATSPGVGDDLVCNGQGPNAIQNHTQVNTGATDGAANGFHWGAFPIVGIEAGPFFRIVPGVAGGDSGGPCFWVSGSRIQLAGLNSSAFGREGEHSSSSAIVSTAYAPVVDWIHANTL